jgi:hypothetical protein
LHFDKTFAIFHLVVEVKGDAYGPD